MLRTCTYVRKHGRAHTPLQRVLSAGHNRETTDVLISDLLTLFLLAGMTHKTFMIAYIFSTIYIQTNCLRVSPILPQNGLCSTQNILLF